MSKLLRSTRGAVYVEFLISFLPMCFFFLCVLQYTYVVAADLIVKHAAEVTARSAIVVLHDDPQYYDNVAVGENSGKRHDDIEKAALMVLEPVDGNKQDLQIDMKGSYTRDELVEVGLQFRYTCHIPLARYFICGDAAGGAYSSWERGYMPKKLLTGKAALPNQGASYDY